MKRSIVKVSIVFIVFSLSANVTAQNISDKAKMNDFVGKMMKKMTLDEKLGQLNLITPGASTGPFANKKPLQKIMDGTAGNVFNMLGSINTIRTKFSLVDSTRLKIPLLSGFDIIHGAKTIFPNPLGLSCTWDMPLIEQTARVAAIEASATGCNWTFSPMVDLTRDPRWGRVMEGSGEDAYLGSKIAQAMVRGYQGSNLSDSTSILACVKHFAMYGASEGGRDYNTVDMSRLSMYQDYLRPYKAAIDAGAGSIMTSFNEVNGIPSTANKWLLTDVLRRNGVLKVL